MGVSCISRPRRIDIKKGDNKSNTLSSQLNSKQQISSQKVISLSLPQSAFQTYFPSKYQFYLNEEVQCFKDLEIHRQYRYSQLLSGFVQKNKKIWKMDNDQKCKVNICCHMDRQYWQSRSFRALSINCLSIVLESQITNYNQKIHLQQINLISQPQPKYSYPNQLIYIKINKIQNLFEMRLINSTQKIEEVGIQLINKYKRFQSLTAPYFSTIIFEDKQKRKKTDYKHPIDSIFGFETNYVELQLLLYLNDQSESNFKQSYLELTYFQMASIFQLHFISFWRIHNFPSIQQNFPKSKFYCYALLQMLRCLISFNEMKKINNQKIQTLKQLEDQTINMINDFMQLKQNIISNISFLFQVFLLFNGVNENKTKPIILYALQSVFKQTKFMVDGLWYEFGLQINQKQHPFKNQQYHFLKRISHDQILKSESFNFIKKVIIYPLNNLKSIILNSLQKIQKLSCNLSMHQLKDISSQFYLNCGSDKNLPQLLNKDGNQICYEKIIFQDFIIRLMLYDYYLHLAQGDNLDFLWTKINSAVSKTKHISGEVMLVFFTLAAINCYFQLNKEKQNQQQFYLLRAFEVSQKLYGDSRAFKKNDFQKEHFWQFLILEHFLALYSNSQQKKEYQYFQNIIECLKVDYPQYCESSTNQPKDMGFMNQLRKMLSFIPLQRFHGIFFLRTDIWNLQTQDIKSNFSESMSSTTTKKIKKSSYKITNSEFSAKLTKFNGIIKWGQGVQGPPQIYPPLKNKQIFQICSGNYHIVFATESGIFGWGQNYSGQLGIHNKQKNCQKEIVLIESMKLSAKTDKIQISCGNQHTAVLINGRLYMWGQQEGGILGGNGYNFDKVVCGGLHTLGIKNEQVWSWGRGEGGQLGHPIHLLKQKKRDETIQYFLQKPTLIENLKGVKAVACGDAHSIVLTHEGKVYVFGFSYQGQLGLGLTGQNQQFQIFTPTSLPYFKDVKIINVFAGPTFSFFKTQKNELFSCGMNDCLQLGVQRVMKIFQKKKYLNRTFEGHKRKMGETEFSIPKRIDFFNNETKLNVINIECGQNHCLAMISYMERQQMVMGWGLNKHMQIDWQFNQIIAPRTIDSLFGLNILQLCCTAMNSFALIGQISITTNQLQQFLFHKIKFYREIQISSANPILYPKNIYDSRFCQSQFAKSPEY